MEIITLYMIQGIRDSTVVKALSCHCKDPGSIPDGGLRPTQLQIDGYQLAWEVKAAGAPVLTTLPPFMPLVTKL